MGNNQALSTSYKTLIMFDDSTNEFQKTSRSINDINN